MSTETSERAGSARDSVVALLRGARAARRAVAHPDPAPISSDKDAYAVQAALVPHLGDVAGWKVGRKSPDARPIRAPLIRSATHDSRIVLPRDAFRFWTIEAEIVFRLGRDLPPREGRYTRDDVLQAGDGVHVGFEILDSRFADWPNVPAALVLADSQSHGAMVVGSGRPVLPVEDFLQTPVRLTIDGAVVIERRGGNPAGDVLELVAWLANALADTGAGLRRGDLVTTGSYTGVTTLEPGSTAEADFAGIGSVVLTRAL